jgi:aminoglycoside phosphotransferase (APT) family kinase protein
MLLPADRLLSALATEFAKLIPLLADSGTDGSAAQSIATAILLLNNREKSGTAFVDAQLANLGTVLDSVEKLSRSSAKERVMDMRTRIAQTRDAHDFSAKEVAWRDLLNHMQSYATALLADTTLSASDIKAISAVFVAWEAGDRQAQVAPADIRNNADTVQITVENLTAYLCDRFNEPTMHVTSVTPLAGGFGKETTLFEVSGKALSGAVVMRRDLAGGASITNDCHRNIMEYPVIKAVHARGFPAPDAVWLDTEHKLLPGGDFIIMHKSPGKIGGNFFGAQTSIPDDLVDSLAAIMARLHTLEPLTELGDLNSAINSTLWNKSREESSADYISGWRDYFLANNHTPSPSLMALFGWLLSNAPPRVGRSVLLHGDFGFHNFLFDDGKLSAVLDWEFAHIGDPAEELGYVRETIGNAIDWNRLMAGYVAAGGDPVDDPTLRYFRVWAHVRNAAASNLIAANFIAGLADDLKLAFLPHVHFPMFITAAQALIDEA